MNADLAPLLDLSRAERLQLVEDLWDSLVREQEAPPLPEWKLDELQRRREKFLQNPASVKTWDQVKERARSND